MNTLRPLEVRISARLMSEVVMQAKKHCREHPDKYENFSHYIRTALVKLNREHQLEKYK